VGKGCRVSLYRYGLLYNWVIKGLCGFWHAISGGLSKGYQGLSKGYQGLSKCLSRVIKICGGLSKGYLRVIGNPG